MNNKATSRYPSIARIAFTTDKEIPAGYVVIEDNEVAMQGRIKVEFETYQSFDADLGVGTNIAGYTYVEGETVDCYGIKGITGTLTCKFVKGNATYTRPAPASITVEGFDKIATDT
mmetsp:Transcript_27005/g.4981  ORF Transcript_27005/g.4981 Transcript_27005/m.4981 type:complete len:116 (+) Transcript_27005:4381-4728(+)